MMVHTANEPLSASNVHNGQGSGAFVVGARVAIRRRSGFSGYDYKEGFVGKVYKNGNFVLRGDTQQWRPSYSGKLARKTGDSSWHPAVAILWDAEADKEIQEHTAAAAHARNLNDLQERVRAIRLGDITPEQIAKITAILTSSHDALATASSDVGTQND